MSALDNRSSGKTLLIIGALAGATAVAAGAFGAHFLHDRLANLGHVDTWNTAVLYNLVHAVAAIAVGVGNRTSRATMRLWLLGILFFSGSLYTWSLGGPKWMVHITPFGGLCLIVGWIWLAADHIRSSSGGVP